MIKQLVRRFIPQDILDCAEVWLMGFALAALAVGFIAWLIWGCFQPRRPIPSHIIALSIGIAIGIFEG